MNAIKVLFAASEAAPFVKVGGLADVVGALPRTLVKHGVDARVILPLYRKIKQSYMSRLQFHGWKMVRMGWRSLYAGLFSMELDGVIFYFIDNEYYFNFEQVYVEYTFDIERYCFYQRAVLDFMGDFIQFEPDVLHINDWQTGMIPLLLDAHYRSRGLHTDVKTVFTIHNLKYQGIQGTEMIRDLLDLPDTYLSEDLFLKDGAANFMKAGIVYANSVTTVSPTYAYEIMTDYYGEGLNGVLRRYAYKVSGILNGIDEKEYDPTTDAFLPVPYDTASFDEGKAECKRILQKRLGLAENPGAPLCVMVSRLVDQKGLDLFLRVLDEMLFDGMQVAVLGTGDAYYENALKQIADQNPGKMCACITFDNSLAHKMYAGADLYLMPSIFEPCGLSQMIAMRYGTIPVVRETGGLKDTVTPYNEYTGEGNGFSFANINAHEFLFVTKYACDIYRHQKNVWQHLMHNAMSGDYSWDRSAAEYEGLYRLITGISQTEETAKETNTETKPLPPSPSYTTNPDAVPAKKPTTKRIKKESDPGSASAENDKKKAKPSAAKKSTSPRKGSDDKGKDKTKS